MAGYPMNYLALVARNVEPVCRFLGTSLGLMRTDVSLHGRTIRFFGIGASAIALFDADDPYLEEPRLSVNTRTVASLSLVATPRWSIL